MHILKWPELDIFDMFLKSGLDKLRLNRIKNRIGHYANLMLKENLTEAMREGSKGTVGKLSRFEQCYTACLRYIFATNFPQIDYF